MISAVQNSTKNDATTHAYMQDFKKRLRLAFREARMGYVKYPWIYL